MAEAVVVHAVPVARFGPHVARPLLVLVGQVEVVADLVGMGVVAGHRGRVVERELEVVLARKDRDVLGTQRRIRPQHVPADVAGDRDDTSVVPRQERGRVRFGLGNGCERVAEHRLEVVGLRGAAFVDRPIRSVQTEQRERAPPGDGKCVAGTRRSPPSPREFQDLAPLTGPITVGAFVRRNSSLLPSLGVVSVCIRRCTSR